jgi:hypothetical protein
MLNLLLKTGKREERKIRKDRQLKKGRESGLYPKLKLYP